MASEVDISNLALSLIGERAEVIAIVPPDGSTEAQLCGRFYPMARDEMLEMHPWTFAMRRLSMAQLTNDRPSWGYAYQIPADCLKPRAVLLNEACDDAVSEDFIVETNDTGTKVLYTNTPTATLRYTRAVTDTTRFTPMFVAALGRLLATKLAGAIIKGGEGMQVAQSHTKLFLMEMAAAKADDANTGSRANQFRDFVPSAIRGRGAVNTWPRGSR
jgi:hypothetical protein